MDRIFKKLGMSGKSFIPLVIGTGCSVPAIMSTRTIENEKERRLTIMLTPFIPCSAKMPVFTLFITVFFFNNSLMAPALYAIGIIIVIISGLILKRTKLFKKDESTFILELPDYRFPRIKNLFLHTYEKIKSFIIKAGTIIFVACIVIWFLQSFDWSLVRVDTEQSILRSIGEFIAPIFIPLGWGNWESTVAIISGFLAKETIVATFGIILGEEFLTISLTNLFTTASALSFVIFILLASPCFAAIGATRREMGSWKWTFITLIYQTGLAYLVSLMVYQVGNVIL
jgi:ferrous iron transport protein B